MNVKKLIANGDLIDINKKQRRYFIIKSQEEMLKIGKKIREGLRMAMARAETRARRRARNTTSQPLIMTYPTHDIDDLKNEIKRDILDTLLESVKYRIDDKLTGNTAAIGDISSELYEPLKNHPLFPRIKKTGKPIAFSTFSSNFAVSRAKLH